jgi:hypothetical protein
VEIVSRDTQDKRQEQLNEYIQEMSRLLDLMCSGFKEVNRKNSTFYHFMMDLLNTYCLLNLDSSLIKTQKMQEFLQESAPKIAPLAFLNIGDFQTDIEDLFSQDTDYDPWPEVCKRRSAFEALRELFHDTQYSDLKEYLDLSSPNQDFNPEDIDYVIEYRAIPKPVSDDEIPEGIPRSHWWWWGERTEAEAA